MISPPISCHQSGDADPADLLVDGAPSLDIFELKISVDQVADWSQYVDNAIAGTGMRADARARSADAGRMRNHGQRAPYMAGRSLACGGVRP
jgi:hypothetical protein